MEIWKPVASHPDYEVSILAENVNYVRELEAKVQRLEASERELLRQLRDAEAAEIAATVEIERLKRLVEVVA